MVTEAAGIPSGRPLACLFAALLLALPFRHVGSLGGHPWIAARQDRRYHRRDPRHRIGKEEADLIEREELARVQTPVVFAEADEFLE
ncbi:hypothetical protein D3C71_1979950 [compost metagenome]